MFTEFKIIFQLIIIYCICVCVISIHTESELIDWIWIAYGDVVISGAYYYNNLSRLLFNKH